MIGDKAEICDGTEAFNMLNEDADDLVDEDERNVVPPLTPLPAAVPAESVASIKISVPVTPKKWAWLRGLRLKLKKKMTSWQ